MQKLLSAVNLSHMIWVHGPIITTLEEVFVSRAPVIKLDLDFEKVLNSTWEIFQGNDLSFDNLSW